MSLERLIASAAAQRRLRARYVLIQVQAAQCNGETWEKLQEQLIAELE